MKNLIYIQPNLYRPLSGNGNGVQTLCTSSSEEEI